MLSPTCRRAQSVLFLRLSLPAGLWPAKPKMPAPGALWLEEGLFPPGRLCLLAKLSVMKTPFPGPSSNRRTLAQRLLLLLPGLMRRILRVAIVFLLFPLAVRK